MCLVNYATHMRHNKSMNIIKSKESKTQKVFNNYLIYSHLNTNETK